MPSRKSSSATFPRAFIVLAGLAVLLVLVAEGSRLWGDDAGRLIRGFGRGGRAEVEMGREMRRGLEAAGIPPESIRALPSKDGAPTRWRAGLAAEASLLQANYAVSRRIEDAGGEVVSGRESYGNDGDTRVTLAFGPKGRTTHELTLVRAPLPVERTQPDSRIALVVFGFGDDLERARAFFDLPAPFAVAIVPGSRESGDLFRAARASHREVVLHVPLEPINYPQIDPGPGTLLVTMTPARVTGIMRRYLDQAGAVAAVANHMGSLATQDGAVMEAVYRELKRRSLPFIHVQPAAGAVCRGLAADLGVVYDEPTAVLDAEARQDSPKALERRWAEILEGARSHGRTTVWVRATPTAREWLMKVAKGHRPDGVSLVSLSSAIRRPAVL